MPIALQRAPESTPDSHPPSNHVERGQRRPLPSKRPRDLYELWREYQFGSSGCIPARLFTEKERGATKFKYCFRAKFWRLVEGLLSRGYTSDTAIDAIYAKYGREKSVTTILTELRRSKPQPSDI